MGKSNSEMPNINREVLFNPFASQTKFSHGSIDANVPIDHKMQYLGNTQLVVNHNRVNSYNASKGKKLNKNFGIENPSILNILQRDNEHSGQHFSMQDARSRDKNLKNIRALSKDIQNINITIESKREILSGSDKMSKYEAIRHKKIKALGKEYLHDYAEFNFKIDSILNEGYVFIKNAKPKKIKASRINKEDISTLVKF